jgi:MFS family permease
MASETSSSSRLGDSGRTGSRPRASAAAWLAVSIAALFFLYEFMTRVEPSLAAQSIEDFYHLTDARFGTLSSLFFWVYAPMQIVVGLLLDRYGARRFVLLGILLCGGGVLLFAATGVVAVAAAGRLMTGFGASFAFVAALWLVNHWFPPTRFAFLSSSVTAVGMLGTAVGGVALSQVIATHGWREVFLATSAGGAVLFVAALLCLREPVSPASGSTSGFATHVRRNLTAIGGNLRAWVIAIIGLLYYVPINVYAGLWGTTELVKDHHLSHVTAESLIALIFWGLTVGSVAGGWLSDRLGHRKFLVFFGAAATAIAYAAELVFHEPTWVLGTLLFAGGFFGGPQMLVFAMAKEGQPNGLAGTVIAFVNMIGIGGALVMQPLVGWLADLTGGTFQLALLVVPLSSALAAVLVLLLPEYRHPDHSVETPRRALNRSLPAR